MVTSNRSSIDEKRRSQRVRVLGCVIVHAHQDARGRTLDLSRSGIQVRLADGEPRCLAGDCVAIDFHLDASGSTWLRFDGYVRRATRGVVAIEFVQVPGDFASVYAEVAVAELEHATAPYVLLVDPVATDRARCASALRRAGCRVTEVATPLETVAHLTGSRGHRWTIAISHNVPLAIADELRAFLRAGCDRQVEVISIGPADDVATLIPTRWPET